MAPPGAAPAVDALLARSAFGLVGPIAELGHPILWAKGVDVVVRRMQINRVPPGCAALFGREEGQNGARDFLQGQLRDRRLGALPLAIYIPILLPEMHERSPLRRGERRDGIPRDDVTEHLPFGLVRCLRK